jgi:thioredoxin-like negative regulator of GroEL
VLERLVVVAFVVTAALAVSLVVRTLARRRMVAAAERPLPAALLSRLPGRDPAIVYFYGPHCGTCRQQASVLDQIAASGSVPVVRVDAAREPAIADALAVLTVPTTVIVDGQRQVRVINPGFRSDQALAAQLQAL